MTLPGSTAPVPPESFVPPTAEELGAMLPHYEISHLIAAGGMGAVYAGMQRALDRAVAIKILPPDAARDGESIGRFRTEAKAMARLTHPNIPAVYDFDVSAGYCYLVMEYVDGWNVHQLITQSELTPDLTYSLLSQVCDALHYAHQRGIVHGDIKPSNLLVTQEGTVKLADFGLAQLTGSRETETFAPMGTPEYAAPELWQPGVEMDHRADLYSLGCVFYEMLTGAAPQGQFTLPAAALRLDHRVDTVIARCMQQKPDLRYQSAAEVRAAIEAIRAPAPGTTLVKPAVRIVRPPARRPTAGSNTRRRAKKPTSAGPVLWVLGLGLALVAGAFLLKEKPASSSVSAGSSDHATSSAAVAPQNENVATPSVPGIPPAATPGEETPPRPVPAQMPASTTLATTPPPALTNALSAATAEKIMAFRAKYRAEWQSAVSSRLTTERDRLAAYYLTALEKYRDEAAKLNDTAALLAIRNETDRFKSTREGLPEAQYSSIAKLATLQKTLTTSLAAASAKLKQPADQLRERCLLELKQIETAAASGDQEIVSTLYDKLVATPDLASVLAD